MSSRTVIEIHPGDGDSFMIWLYEPSHVPNAALVKRFPYCSSDPVPTAFTNGVGTVGEIGGYLMDALVQHPAVAQAFRALLDTAPNAPQPLLLRISPEAENVPWETVFANGTFLALDQRWPIARMSYQDGGGPAERDFQPPLHVMLILAADGVDATAEWEGILAALQAARFPVMVTAIVAQRELRDKIAATNVANVSVRVHMVPLGRGLIDLIRDAQPSPNVLHFFCHGARSAGKPYLRIGTALSAIEPDKPDKAVTLFADDIPVDALGDRLWLVTLNCCRGAQGAEGAPSLVFALMRAGIPAVAGMRLPVSDTDANVFSNSFYRSLMRLLAPAAKPGTRMELNWAQTLYEARMALCEQHRTAPTWAEQATASREWTLPVLYVTGRPFTLRGRAARRAAAGRGGTRRGILGDTPEQQANDQAEPEFAPPLMADERVAAETELQMLRGLVGLGLGAPPEALRAYQDRIRQLELELYGAD